MGSAASDCRENYFGRVVSIRNSNRPELVRFQFVFFLGEEEQIPPIKGSVESWFSLWCFIPESNGQSSNMKMHTLFLFKIDQNWRQWPNEPCMLQYSTEKRQTYVSFQESSNFLAFVRCNFLKIAIFRSLKCRFALLLDTFWIIIRTLAVKGYPLMPIWSLSDDIFMGNKLRAF